MRRSVDVCPMTSLTESTVAVAALTWLTQLVFGELPVDSRTHERPSGRESGIFRLLTARVRTGLVAAAMAATVPMITFAQTTEPAIEKLPAVVKAAVANTSPTGVENGTDKSASVENGPSVKPAIPAFVEVEIQSRFNELRGKLLDDRAAYIDRWLIVVTIVLTFFGIVTVVGGYISFRRFREIETEAKNSVATVTKLAEVAQRNLEEIEKNRKKSDEILRDLSAETAAADPQEAEQAVANVRENPTASLVDQVIALAVSLQQQDKREEAIEKWRAVAHFAEGIDNDLAARAWFSVGYLLQQESEAEANALKLEEAIGAYDEAIRLNPDYAEVYNNRAVAKNTLGRHDAAIADCDEAIRLRPDFAEAYNNRGAAKNALRRHDSAIADFDEAIKLKPDYAEAYNNRGNAKDALERYDAAIADYDKAIRLKPEFAEAYNNRGDTKNALGQHDAAIADYDEAIRLKPDYVEAYYNRGIAKGKLDQYEYAIADFDEAIRLKPDYANAYNGRGASKAALGRHDAAIADYNDAIKLKPDNATAYYNRGLAKNTLGLKDDARKDFETALELARNAGNEELVAKAEEKLGNLATDGDT